MYILTQNAAGCNYKYGNIHNQAHYAASTVWTGWFYYIYYVPLERPHNHFTDYAQLQLEGIISSKSSTNSTFTTNYSYNRFNLVLKKFKFKNIHPFSE